MIKVDNTISSKINILSTSKRDYIYLKDEDKVITSIFYLKDNSSLDIKIIDFSSANSNFNIQVNLGFNSKVNFNIASFSFLNKKKIYNIKINHLKSNSYSRINMVGINNDSATLRFIGSSFIKSKAKGSDTRQVGRITNLSKDCISEVSPLLLIKENDVKASHGASLGSYNPKDLYYLLSRGLTLNESKLLISKGQFVSIINSIDDKKIIDILNNKIEEVLK